MASIRPSPALRARARSLIHRGVVEAEAVLVDEALPGPREARRRAVAVWAPGVTVHRMEGGLLVVFPTPRWIDCARAPGLLLVRTRPRAGAHGAGRAPAHDVLASAPLTPAELTALAPPPGTVVLVRGGAPVAVLPGDADDPAGYLDVSAFAPVPVAALGPSPPAPRVTVARPVMAPRRLLGVAEPPLQMADVLSALRAARRGEVPARVEPVARRGALFAGLLSALAALVARVRALAGRPGRARAGDGAVRALVVAQAPVGPSLFQRFGAALRTLFARALVRADLASYLGQRQADYMGKMLDLFERGELSEALRHAIPLGSEASEGAEPPAPMLGLPTPRMELSISGGRGAGGGSALFAPENFYADLRRRYRAAFERLEREGRIEEAAFVLAELLRESAEAVAFLERHRRFRLAAEIAEARGLPPALLVRQWLLAGDAAHAVRLARRHGAFAEALTRLGDHPQAAVLRLLWAGTLAEAGDFAAAVDTAWPVPGARPTAAAWIDAAIAQGGAAAARMLARKLSLVPGSFPEVRALALALLDEEGPGAAQERHAFAEALLAEGASPAACTLARAAIRALVREGGRSGEPAARLLVERLTAFAGDDALRADQPAWPVVVPGPPARPRQVLVAAADTGATPVHDAVHLPGGRTLLALGEAGVRVLGRSGQVLFDLDQPAHRLVISDRGDRALGLSRRGDAWRVARLDLVGRRAEVWCEARFDCAATDFDGSQWVVAAGREILVIDALERGFDALGSFELTEGPALALARSPGGCTVALAPPESLLARRRYDLPSWTLRQRGPVESARLPPPRAPLFAAGGDGTVALLASPHDGLRWTGVDHPHLLLGREGKPLQETPIEAPPGAAPAALSLAPGWAAAGLRSPSRIDVELLSLEYPAAGAFVVLMGASQVSLRVFKETFTIADDRGRVLVMDLARGALLVDARV